jgi:hypothetical protein
MKKSRFLIFAAAICLMIMIKCTDRQYGLNHVIIDSKSIEKNGFVLINHIGLIDETNVTSIQRVCSHHSEIFEDQITLDINLCYPNTVWRYRIILDSKKGEGLIFGILNNYEFTLMKLDHLESNISICGVESGSELFLNGKIVCKTESYNRHNKLEVKYTEFLFSFLPVHI